MLLLDTNILSYLRRADRIDPAVRALAAAASLDTACVSAITILELELGTLRMERRDPRQGAELRAWLDGHILPRYESRTLPIDTAIVRRCAALHVPDPRPYNDALIAATALIHGLTLVTRNAADFTPMGVSILNPWEIA